MEGKEKPDLSVPFPLVPWSIEPARHTERSLRGNTSYWRSNLRATSPTAWKLLSESLSIVSIVVWW